MRGCLVLLLAGACGSRAAAPGVGAPHVAPAPRAHVAALQPTFAAETIPAPPRVSFEDPKRQISDGERVALAAHLAHAVAREASGYAITATISALTITRDRVACSVSVLVAPHDGLEHWDSERTAIARGSAVASGGSADVRACLEATIDEVIAHRVLPFLRRRSSMFVE
jgi:hypothetical protein